MQISRIYSNKPNIFTTVDFNYGIEANRLNVIFGEVLHPTDQKRDSHNLGKTTLLHLIDFLLLKGSTSDHFLFKHKDRFQAFVFYIELALNDGSHATIRRGAANPNSIAMKRHSNSGLQLADEAEDFWDHPELSRDNAVQLLDGWLDLQVLKPYDYRKAITYFLRAQGDYGDELQLQKFQVGSHRDWKPFVAHLFGFNEAPVRRKYELDDSIAKIKNELDDRQSEVQFTEDQLPALGARISVLQQQTDETERALDAFSFDAEEQRMVKNLVDTIEVEIAGINDQIYNLRYDLAQINDALSHKDKFDMKEVNEIFKEVGLHFPDQLKHSYEELVSFNRKITRERNTALRSRQKKLAEEEYQLSNRKRNLDGEREAKLRILRGRDTFEKFKALQIEFTNARARIIYLNEQRKKLDQVANLARQMREEERERGRVVDELKAMVSKPTTICDRFISVFNSYCQRVLNHDGLFYFKVNASGNLDYDIRLSLSGQTDVPSSQSEGTSYKKLICALFDLALLKVYEDGLFFHFVYHDGILEGLDDRKKRSLLGVVREQIESKKTQYIFTLIDSDTPRDETGEKVIFPENEIVLRLHDDGQSGRLFKMNEF